MAPSKRKGPAVSGGPWCLLVIAFDRAIYRTLHRPPLGGVVFIAVIRFREMAAAFIGAERRRRSSRVSNPLQFFTVEAL